MLQVSHTFQTVEVGTANYSAAKNIGLQTRSKNPLAKFCVCSNSQSFTKSTPTLVLVLHDRIYRESTHTYYYLPAHNKRHFPTHYIYTHVQWKMLAFFEGRPTVCLPTPFLLLLCFAELVWPC